MTSIKTIVADMHELFAEGFERLLLDMDYPHVQISDRATDAHGLLEALSTQPVDLIFMEINFTDKEGMELISEIKTDYPDTRICILSGYTDHKLVKEAFKRGVDGYYSKYNSQAELVECVNEIMLGHTFLASGIHITPRKNATAPSAPTMKSGMEDRFLLKKKLTKREQEVLELITKAMNNKEIADKLYISDQTVGVHRKNIMRKLNVRNTVNLIKFALDHQLV